MTELTPDAINPYLLAATIHANRLHHDKDSKRLKDDLLMLNNSVVGYMQDQNSINLTTVNWFKFHDELIEALRKTVVALSFAIICIACGLVIHVWRAH